MSSLENQSARFAEWNIKSGGFKEYTHDREAKPTHLSLIQQAIGLLDADFISFIDTFRWDELYSSDDLRRLFGYTYVENVSLGDERLQKLGHDNGVAVLTRLPVADSEVIRMHNRNALLTTICLNDQPVDVVTLYLDDVNEETRMFQIRALLSHLRVSRPTILMGDLNTMDTKELQKSRSLIKAISTKHKEVTRLLWPKLLSLQEGTVIPLLRAHGFTDAATEHVPNVPTTLLGKEIKHPVFRLDYIFCTDSINCSPTEVVFGDIFQKSSDHYPIMCAVSTNEP
jgi:endonuclease/exonuclease/phosphatase family metal-dependent hydrolase